MNINIMKIWRLLKEFKMIKGKRGQFFFYALMMGVVFFLMGLALTPAISQVVNEQMDSTLLNCSNSTISQQNHAVCTSLDMTKFLFIGVIFGLVGILIGGAVGR